MFRPGQAYHYSNPNFILAAYFIEKYSGMTFRDYLQRNIFSRIGLKDTHFDFYNEALQYDRPKRVEQYFKYYDNTTRSLKLMSIGKDLVQIDRGVSSGTGVIISTAKELVTFWYAVFNPTTKGAPLLSAASQKALLTPWSLAFHQKNWLFPDGSQRPIWGVLYTRNHPAL